MSMDHRIGRHRHRGIQPDTLTQIHVRFERYSSVSTYVVENIILYNRYDIF
jgi:hypothetical protein